MDQYIISQNNANLRNVLRTVSNCTHDKVVRDMATKALGKLDDTAMLPGISADRGLPFIGYAKTADALWDTSKRKVATLAKFYVKYVDSAAVPADVDKLVFNVTEQAIRLGYYLP